MTLSTRFFAIAFSLLVASVSFSCGGGDNSPSSTDSGSTTVPAEEGAPTATGTTAKDGFAWINFRRSATGLQPLALSNEIEKAAQSHSTYQKINGPFYDTESGSNSPITHLETSGKPGFTGVNACPQRMSAAGFDFGDQYGCAETISALISDSGFDAAEELIAAIYHRFIILQPSFREAGAGAAASYDGRYTIFTQNFAVRGSFANLGDGAVVNYPYHSQKLVPTSFAHFTEHPDPLPSSTYPQYAGKQVGYPVSVHADLDKRIDVTNFVIRRQGSGIPLSGRILSGATDENTQYFSAAIVPYHPLASSTVYAVQFTGTLCTKNSNNDTCISPPVPVSRDWSFTTR